VRVAQRALGRVGNSGKIVRATGIVSMVPGLFGRFDHWALCQIGSQVATRLHFFGLLQLLVLRLGFLQDGDVGVGVFPEGKEVLVPLAGTFFVARDSLGSSQLQVR